MSKPSLRENYLTSEAGDTARSKAQHDAYSPTGKCKELKERAMPVMDKAKVVDEAGDAGLKSVISDPTGTQKELDEDKEATPVAHGAANGDLCTELLEHDVATARPPEKPDGDEAVHDAYASPVPLGVAERLKTAPEDLQARDQQGDGSHLLHAEPGKDDQRSHSSGFITHLAEEGFARALKYVKATLSLDTIQKLADTFNEALANKYRLLALPKSLVLKLQWGKLAAYREHETAARK